MKKGNKVYCLFIFKIVWMVIVVIFIFGIVWIYFNLVFNMYDFVIMFFFEKINIKNFFEGFVLFIIIVYVIGFMVLFFL